MSLPHLVLLSSLWLGPGRSAEAQQSRTPTLTPATTESFGSIGATLETADGVLVVEPQAGTVWLVAPNGARRAWSRGSLTAPGALLLFGDTVLVYERSSQGFLILKRDGTTAPPPSRFVTEDAPGRIELSSDRYAGHASGSLAWADRPRGAPAAILRLRQPGSAVWDSVATLAVAPTRTFREGAIGMTVTIPFSPTDTWTFLPDGGLAIVRAVPYRVDRMLPDRRLLEGRAHVVTPSRVTAADRDAHRAGSARDLQRVNIAGVQMPTIPDTEWPETLPPFIGKAAVAAPDGAVWVRRARSVTEPGTHYDVFEPGGGWRETVVLPSASTITGFGVAHAYVVTSSADRDTLHRFPWK